MNKEEKEAKAKAEKQQEQEDEKPFDIRSLVGWNKTELAKIYNVSLSTFEKDIAAIKPLLDAEDERMRPGCKRGPQRFWLAKVQILVAHIGEPP